MDFIMNFSPFSNIHLKSQKVKVKSLMLQAFCSCWPQARPTDLYRCLGRCFVGELVTTSQKKMANGGFLSHGGTLEMDG